MEIGTIGKFNVKPGDVVECVSHYYTDHDVFIPGKHYTVDQYGMFTSEHGNTLTGNCAVWRIVSRASDETPKMWRDMTDEEKGALLLAEYRDQTIRYGHYPSDNFCMKKVGKGGWIGHWYYMAIPEPVRETVTLTSWGTCNNWVRNGDLSRVHDSHRKYRITFDKIDGKPDADSIKMEEL